MQLIALTGLYAYVPITPAVWCFIVSGMSAAVFAVLLLYRSAR